MKSYKDFEKIYIGYSDVAALTIQVCGDDGISAFPIFFGSDGGYSAYFVDAPAEIGGHYKLIKTVEFCSWFKVFDDEGKTFYHRLDWKTHQNVLKIWRAGEYGIIFQLDYEGGKIK